MRILCCLDGTNAAEIAKAVALLASGEPLTYGLLYVTDTEPAERLSAPASAFCVRHRVHVRRVMTRCAR
jgi:hypothetical protein